MKTYYLDHNATTPMTPDALQAMIDTERDVFGNASSSHAAGQQAREYLEEARAGIAKQINCKPKELFFTSGGTEGNNWAINGLLWPRPDYGIMVSSIEHKSLLKAVEANQWDRLRPHVRVDKSGIVDVGNAIWAMKEVNKEGSRNFLLSIMLANNETGVIQPLKQMIKEIREHYPLTLIHTDACQAFGKIPVDVEALGVDAMTLSAHKVGGTKGMGALFLREGTVISPLIRGGHQERDLRAGTENVAGAVGFHAAVAHRYASIESFGEHVIGLRSKLEGLLTSKIPNTIVNSGTAERLPNTLNVSFKDIDSEALVLMLSSLGIFVSNGSACEAGRSEGSHVLKAMGQTDEEARSAIRFSFSDDTSLEDIDEIASFVIATVFELREMFAQTYHV